LHNYVNVLAKEFLCFYHKEVIIMIDYENAFNNLVSSLKIPVIKDRNYWLIRTEGGSYYFDGYITLSVENKKRDVKNHLSL